MVVYAILQGFSEAAEQVREISMPFTNLGKGHFAA
jgi:hypothetical protein